MDSPRGQLSRRSATSLPEEDLHGKNKRKEIDFLDQETPKKPRTPRVHMGFVAAAKVVSGSAQPPKKPPTQETAGEDNRNAIKAGKRHVVHDVEAGKNNQMPHNSSYDRVKCWLRELGLEMYVPFFEVHKVDDDRFLSLTPDYLRNMGIHDVGVQIEMINSIKRMHAVKGGGN